MKRLHLHGSKATDGRHLVQFIALILISALRKEMRQHRLIKDYAIREILKEMEMLTKITYSGKYGYILQEATKPQKRFFQNLKSSLTTIHSYKTSGNFGCKIKN